MEKIDFRKELKELYSPSSKAFSEIVVPPMNFLMVDGKGDPNTCKEYAQAIEALYSVAYTLKFASKKELGKDYTVPPLEGLWWADDMSDFMNAKKSKWRWTAMIMTPKWITPAMFASAVEAVREKKDPPALALLRLERFDEGRSVQIMHIGPYAEEGPVISRLHELVPNGKHHEIYLSDPRKTQAAKLKTVIRQPVKAASAAFSK